MHSAFSNVSSPNISSVSGLSTNSPTMPAHSLGPAIVPVAIILGAFLNTNLFNPTKEKYYAVFLMRMDAKQYVLINYGYAILKFIIGFLPFMILMRPLLNVPLWLSIILPFSIAGLKLFVAASSLWDYEKRGFAYNENKLGKFLWAFVALMIILMKHY